MFESNISLLLWTRALPLPGYEFFPVTERHLRNVSLILILSVVTVWLDSPWPFHLFSSMQPLSLTLSSLKKCMLFLSFVLVLRRDLGLSLVSAISVSLCVYMGIIVSMP